LKNSYPVQRMTGRRLNTNRNVMKPCATIPHIIYGCLMNAVYTFGCGWYNFPSIIVQAIVWMKDWTRMIRPVHLWRKLKCWYGIPVNKLRMESRLHRPIVKGVRAYARAPTRSLKPPRPVLVLNLSEFLTGVIHVS